jgi:hypothetical protein
MYIENIKILVPYRNTEDNVRLQQLHQFVEYMNVNFPNHDVYIAEQADDGRKFNRGAMLNSAIKYWCMDNPAQSVLLHDVDLLPHSVLRMYYEHPVPEKICVHLGSFWKTKYNYDGFFGGIHAIRVDDFVKCNGFPNKCWGWGGEDDIFKRRLEQSGIGIAKPLMSPEVDTSQFIYELPHKHMGDDSATKNMTRWEDIELYSNNMADGIHTLSFIAKDVNNRHAVFSII